MAHSLARRARRLALFVGNTAVVLFGVSVLAFVLTMLTPGDVAENVLSSKGIPPTPEMVAQVRQQLGLDRPLVEQYLSWLGRLVQGDLGTSLSMGTSIGADFVLRAPITLELTLAGLLGAWALALPVALAAAARQGGFFDRLVRLLSYVGSALPSFIVALGVLYLLGVQLRWFPITAAPGAAGLVMPTLAMIVAGSGWYVRQIRTIAVEEYGKPYVEGMRIRGLGEVRIARHVLRSIAAPIVTLAGNSFGALLAGSAVVEAIFSVRGLGQYALQAITAKDYPVIQAYVIWCALAFLISNVLADVLAFALDPRFSGHAGAGRTKPLPDDAPELVIQHVDLESLSGTATPVRRASRRRGLSSLIVWRLLLGGIVLIVLAGLFASSLAPYDPYATAMREALRAPDGTHLLGTDALGRDILSRVIAGIGPTIAIAATVVLAALAIGALVGVLSALAGGVVDATLQRITAVFQAFPEFVLALALAAMLRPGGTSAVIALTAAYWPKVARYARILTMQLLEAPFVEIARMNGVPLHRLIARHLIPNIGSPLLVLAASDIGSVILNLATLSFVGLGLPQPTAEWGTMISEGRTYLQVAPWLVAGPGLALFLVVLIVNLFADTSQNLLAVKAPTSD